MTNIRNDRLSLSQSCVVLEQTGFFQKIRKKDKTSEKYNLSDAHMLRLARKAPESLKRAQCRTL